MRPALALILVPLLPLVQFACGSDDEVTAPTSDGGSATLDAATSSDDASPSETGSPVDAGGDSVQPGTVTVIVTSQSTQMPVGGVEIVFSDPSGATISEGITDATGTVARAVPAGSSVTAVMGTTARPQLLTVLGVEPGDVLRPIEMSDIDFSTRKVSIESWPTPPVGAVKFFGYVGDCDGNNPRATAPITVGLARYCVSATGHLPTLLTTQDVAFSPVAYAFDKSPSFADAGAPDGAAADAGVWSVNVGGTWHTNFTENVVTANNPPPGASGFVALTELAAGGGRVESSGFAGANANVTEKFTGHPDFADAVQAESDVIVRGVGVSYNAIAMRSPTPADGGASSIDLSQLLPRITDAGVDNSAQLTASWTAESPMTEADGTVVYVAWRRASTDSGVYDVFGSWTFLAPSTATSVTSPTLPSGASGFAPTSTAVFEKYPVVMSFDASFVSSYAGLRGVLSSVPPTFNLIEDRDRPVVPPLPQDGTVRLSGWTNQSD